MLVSFAVGVLTNAEYSLAAVASLDLAFVDLISRQRHPRSPP